MNNVQQEYLKQMMMILKNQTDGADDLINLSVAVSNFQIEITKELEVTIDNLLKPRQPEPKKKVSKPVLNDDQKAALLYYEWNNADLDNFPEQDEVRIMEGLIQLGHPHPNRVIFIEGSLGSFPQINWDNPDFNYLNFIQTYMDTHGYGPFNN